MPTRLRFIGLTNLTSRCPDTILLKLSLFLLMTEMQYNPVGESRLREIFLKTDNHIKGRYLAELTRGRAMA